MVTGSLTLLDLHVWSNSLGQCINLNIQVTWIYSILTPRNDCFVCHKAGVSTMFSNCSDGLSQPSLVSLAPVTHSLPRRSPASGTLIFLRMLSALAGPEWSWKCNNKEIIGSYIHSILANYLQLHIKYCKFFITSGTGWKWNIEMQSTRVCCCRKKCAAPENLQVLPSQMGLEFPGSREIFKD